MDGGGHLLPGDGKVRTEGVIVKSVQDAVIGGPYGGLGIPGSLGDIRIEIPELRLGIAVHGVQGLHCLGAGHRLFRLKQPGTDAGHIAAVHGGIDIVLIPGILHIGKHPGSRRDLHRHVFLRHGKGIYAGAPHGIKLHFRRGCFHGLHPFPLRQLHRHAHLFSGRGGRRLRLHGGLRIAAVAADAEGTLRQDDRRHRHVGIGHDGLIFRLLLLRHGDAVSRCVLHPHEGGAVAVFRQHRHFQRPARRQIRLGQADGSVADFRGRHRMLHRIGIDDVLSCQHSHREDQKDGQSQDQICSCFLHDPHLLTVRPDRVFLI